MPATPFLDRIRASLAAATSVRKNIRWAPILDRAREIVESYDTKVMLRQLFYRLVSLSLIPNVRSSYARLSALTAKARRQGSFPDLLDKTSGIWRPLSFSGPPTARQWLRDQYERRRTEGQPWSIYLGVEKVGMEEQLKSWFGEQHLPIVALGGYASQTLVDEVREDIEERGQPAVLIYAGDLDPTGEDIDRDFIHRVRHFSRVVRIALDEDQVEEHQLEFNADAEVMDKLGKDPRAAKFQERHGDLVQYELDALDPDVLRDLYENAIDEFWDEEAFQAVLRQEARDKKRL